MSRSVHSTALALCVLVGNAAAGTTIYVDDDAPNDPGPGDPTVSDPAEDGSVAHPFDAIQEGIDATMSNDDVVEVADGTYTGTGNVNLDFGGMLITVQSASGDPAKSTIDCEDVQGTRGFFFQNGETSAAIVDGFTIKRAKQTPFGQGLGGGIYCLGSSPTIRNCVLEVNAAKAGAGIAASGGSPTVVACRFENNCATTGNGGGLYASQGSSPTVINCSFIDNDANHVGGGISIQTVGMTVLLNEITLVNCEFDLNTARDSGGGMRIGVNSTAMVINCTFSRNDVTVASIDDTIRGKGGGISAGGDHPDPIVLANSILWDNMAGEGAEIAAVGGDNVVEIDYSFVGDDQPNDRYDDPNDDISLSFGVGNIDPATDPLFRAAGDFYLTDDSVCVDTGNPDDVEPCPQLDSIVPCDDEDVDGDGDLVEITPDLDLRIRVLDGDNSSGGARVDMGAYEFVWPQDCPWDCQETGGVAEPDGIVGIEDNLDLLAQWGQTGTTCDFDNNGVDIVDFLAQLAAWGVCFSSN